MAIRDAIGGFLGGFIAEGPEVARRTAETQERERAAQLAQININLATSAGIRAQVGLEQDLANSGFNELAPGQGIPESFRGDSTPAQTFQVGEQRFARSDIPLSLEEAGVRSAAGRRQVEPAVVGRALVQLSDFVGAGGDVLKAPSLIEETLGPDVLDSPGFRGVFQSFATAQSTSGRQDRTIEQQNVTNASARAFAVSRDKVNLLQDTRNKANEILAGINDSTIRTIPTIEVVTATGRKMRFNSVRGKGGVQDFLRQSNNPKVQEQVLQAIMESLAGGPSALQDLLDSEQAFSLQGR